VGNEGLLGWPSGVSLGYTLSMYEQAFDRIDDLLRTTTCQTELDYIEQTSWLLFLIKILLNA